MQQPLGRDQRHGHTAKGKELQELLVAVRINIWGMSKLLPKKANNPGTSFRDLGDTQAGITKEVGHTVAAHQDAANPAGTGKRIITALELAETNMTPC